MTTRFIVGDLFIIRQHFNMIIIASDSALLLSNHLVVITYVQGGPAKLRTTYIFDGNI